MTQLKEVTYVKEVETLTEQVKEEIAVQLFQVITNKFNEIAGDPETDNFRQLLLNLRKYERAYFRSIIDDTCNEYNLTGLSWRNVKYEPIRIKRCEVCYKYFYDSSRNGRKLSCYNGDYCDNEYEIRRKRGGTIQEPEYTRNINIIYIDMMPNAGDEKGHAELIEMEMTAYYDRNNVI